VLLEQRRLPDDDIDVEDPAAVRVRALALDVDLPGQRLRLVGEQEVRVGGDDVRRSGRDEDEDGEDGDEPRQSQSRLLVKPPSTAIVAPVTYDACSEARKQTTSPTSRAAPSRPSGMAARSAAVGPSG
jgi:hypothetical protein